MAAPRVSFSDKDLENGEGDGAANRCVRCHEEAAAVDQLTTQHPLLIDGGSFIMRICTC